MDDICLDYMLWQCFMCTQDLEFISNSAAK